MVLGTCLVLLTFPSFSCPYTSSHRTQRLVTTELSPLLTVYTTVCFLLMDVCDHQPLAFVSFVCIKPILLSGYIFGQLSLPLFIRAASVLLCLDAGHAPGQSRGRRPSPVFWLSGYSTTASCSLPVPRRSLGVLTSLSLTPVLLKKLFTQRERQFNPRSVGPGQTTRGK